MKSKMIFISVFKVFFGLLGIITLFVPVIATADCNERIITIQIGNPGPGYESTPNPNEQSNNGLPDFIVKKVILTDRNGNEKYKFYKSDEVKIRALLKNIGDDDIGSDDNIQTRYYLSRGYKEDLHSKWIRVGKDNTKGRNLDPGETHWEEEGLKLWEYDEIQEGKTYNIVVCVDRTKDDHNGDGDYPEIHKSNNCSTEAVFEVLIPNQPPTGFLDSATCDSLSGWTKDPNTTDPIDIHIYVNNSFLGKTTADGYRPDLPYTDKYHGFSYALPESLKDGTAKEYKVYAINYPQGSNPILTHGSFFMSCDNNGAMSVRRFYNSSLVAHYYSINPLDQMIVPERFPDWTAESFTFKAFKDETPETVPLYACWTGNTHDYDTDVSKVGDQKSCQETPRALFYVYQDAGNNNNRTPVYLMYRENYDNYIFAKGDEEASFLQNTYGFDFVYTQPLFWSPE